MALHRDPKLLLIADLLAHLRVKSHIQSRIMQIRRICHFVGLQHFIADFVIKTDNKNISVVAALTDAYGPIWE